MKTSKFFIKSNYIKNAKDNWTFCEGRLLCHQNISFLHLKSLNIDDTSADLFNDTFSNYTGFSTLSQWQQYKSRTKERKTYLNILCNLLEFKSCEIKSVNFEFSYKFAIKLVPSSFMSKKKLYLLPDLENSLTEWCGLLSGFINKVIHSPVINSASDDLSAMTLSSTLRASKVIETTLALPNKNNIYISLDDNDAYESSNRDEFHLIHIEPSEDSVKFNLYGRYLIKVNSESLELMNPSSKEIIHNFPYSSIRRFGANDSILKLETGRHCSTGIGTFTFHVKDAVQIVEKIKENGKQIKNKKNNHNSCIDLNQPLSIDVSLQTESNVVDTSASTNIDNNKDKCILSEMYEHRKMKIYRDNLLKVNTPIESPINVVIPKTEISENEKQFMDEKTQSLNNIDLQEDNPKSNAELFSKETEYPKNKVVTYMEKGDSLGVHNRSLNMLDHDQVMSAIGSQNTKQVRPISHLVNSACNTSLVNLPLPSMEPSPFKNYTPPIKNNFKVSDSTFYKYRGLPKPPFSNLSSFQSKNETEKSLEIIPISIYSPTKSPPPLLPRQKLKFSESNDGQGDYKEFKEMLEDLQVFLD